MPRHLSRSTRPPHGRGDEPVISGRKSAGYRSHESLLLASRFNVPEASSVIIRRPISADEILGRALSMSTCPPGKPGSRLGAFESDLRSALAGLGELAEIAGIVALIARRP